MIFMFLLRITDLKMAAAAACSNLALLATIHSNLAFVTARARSACYSSLHVVAVIFFSMKACACVFMLHLQHSCP